ncbi:MAG: helix-hairpin-helix domain-containing protein [Ruminococcaceae bacterium]|nr:helix-hairpin-helix domain-containing protein [Oscillospiraceae bacterium]
MTKTINIVCVITICVCIVAFGCGKIAEFALSKPDAPATAEPLNITKININTATLEELKTIEALDEQICLNIINYRIKNGSFKSVEEIMQVEGISKEIFVKIFGHIVV